MEQLNWSEVLVQAVAPWLVHVAEACSVLVVLCGVLRAFVQFGWCLVRARGRVAPPTAIRLDLGRSLALGLEFLLAGDVVATAVAPSTDALLQLAAVAIIRTGLNYFLGKELAREAAEVAGARATGGRGS